MSSLNKDNEEIKLNQFIKINLNNPAEKLLSFSLTLVERNKILNEDSHKLIEIQKKLKLREIKNSNKKMELLILEKRMKDKNTCKLNLKNILECYSIILNNNDELLKRRLEQLKERDYNLKKKEFLLSKIKTNEFKLSSNLIHINEKKYAISNERMEKSSDRNINEEMIFEEIRSQFRLFQKANTRNLSIENLSFSKKKKLEVQKIDQINISKSTSPKVKNKRSVCSKNHNKYNVNQKVNIDFDRITEENEDPTVSKRNSTDKKNKSKEKERPPYNDWSIQKNKNSNLVIIKESNNNEENRVTQKSIIFNKFTSKDYKSDENDKTENQNHSKDKGNFKSNRETKLANNKGLQEQKDKNRNNSKDIRNIKKLDKANDKEVFSGVEKTNKITKLVKNKSSEENSNSVNMKSVRVKGIIKVSSNFGKTDKSEDKYRGLARNLSGNKSFDNVRNAYADGSSTINNKDKSNLNDNNHVNQKEVSINSQNENENRNNKNKNDINKDILEKLLKEAEEDAKKRENTKVNSSQSNKEITKITETKNTSKKLNINFNDENLLLISNLLGQNKKVTNASEENNSQNGKSNSIKRENNLAEGLFLLNQNGIFKNKNENLKISSGLNVVLDEDKNRINENNYKKANTDSNRRDKSVSENDRKFKDRIIFKDADKDKEQEIIAKKIKRNTVFLGKDADKKLNINNLNQNQKEVPPKKTDFNKRNSQSKDASENNRNKNNLSLNNNQKQIKNENSEHDFKKDAKEANNTKKYHDIKHNNRNSEDDDHVLEGFIKKLEFKNINKTSNIIIEKETKVTHIREEEINLLLNSKQIDSDNEMMVITENEQILKDEIYIQKMTKYEEELLIKKPIQFNNELKLDNLKVNSMSIEKQEKSYQRDAKKAQNNSSNMDNENKGSSKKGNSFRQENYYYQQENEDDNIIEYEKELAKTNSQSLLDRSSELNSPTPNFTRGGMIEKKSIPFINLKKTAFDSRDESPNNSNNASNKNVSLSPNENKAFNKDSIGNKNVNNSEKNNNNVEKRNSARENSNLKIKKNLINELDLTDSLDTSFNKNSKGKYRNSLDDKSYNNRNTNNDFKNNQTKNQINDKNQTKRGKEESVKTKSLNNKTNYNKDKSKQFGNSNNESKDSKQEKNEIRSIKASSNNDSDKNRNFRNNQQTEFNKFSISNEAKEKIDSIKDQNQNVYKVIEKSEIKESIYESKIKANESNKNVNSNNFSNKDSTDYTISSTKIIDKLNSKNDNSNVGSDINGKYDTCLDDDEDYQEYINKMKQMAVETKLIEDNMRQFANIVQNMVENNK